MMHALSRRAGLFVFLAFVLCTAVPASPVYAVESVLRDLDIVWGAVWDEYADPFFNGVDWHRLPDEYRPRIETAESEIEAYYVLAEMIDRLGDPSTFLVEPTPFQSPVEVEYAGIGVLIGPASALNGLVADGEESFRDDEIAVLEVFDGSPAEEAGLLVGDVIVAVDDWDAAGATVDDVSSRVRGEVGTTVLITLRDPEGHVRTVEVRRDRVDLRPRTEFRSLGNGVAYLRLDTLLARQVAQAKESLAANADATHLILDLRGVATGDPLSMSEAAGWFLGHVELGAFESRYDRFALQTPDKPALYKNELTVLMNGSTSGLGEILALALAEHKRATLIGTPSAGGFSLTRLVHLPSGWSLSLSVARYHSPRGHGLHAEGLTPDIIFDDLTLADYREHKDPVLQRTIEWVGIPSGE